MAGPDDNANGPSAAACEVLSFRVGGSEFSVDITSVREIRSWSETTSLPHAPDFVAGVINLRGTVLPVIDLALRLGLERSRPGDRNVIIVVDVGGRVFGLRVDAVSDILTVGRSALQPPPAFGGDGAARFIAALTILDDRMVRVLDLPAVLPPAADAA